MKLSWSIDTRGKAQQQQQQRNRQEKENRQNPPPNAVCAFHSFIDSFSSSFVLSKRPSKTRMNSRKAIFRLFFSFHEIDSLSCLGAWEDWSRGVIRAENCCRWQQTSTEKGKQDSIHFILSLLFVWSKEFDNEKRSVWRLIRRKNKQKISN